MYVKQDWTCFNLSNTNYCPYLCIQNATKIIWKKQTKKNNCLIWNECETLYIAYGSSLYFIYCLRVKDEKLCKMSTFENFSNENVVRLRYSEINRKTLLFNMLLVHHFIKCLIELIIFKELPTWPKKILH